MKNKKLIKYLRKDIQQSNIHNLNNQKQQEKLLKNLNYFGQQKTNTQQIPEERKKNKKSGQTSLEIPKSLKGQKVLQKLQNKLISILSTKEALINASEIFQHPNLHKVMGSKNKTEDHQYEIKSQPIEEQYYDLENPQIQFSDQEESQFFVPINSQFYNVQNQRREEHLGLNGQRINFLQLMDYEKQGKQKQIQNYERKERKRQLPIVFEQQYQHSRPKTIYFYP